ncbi:unnamed protein product [Heligmosomoides polygyrus]|uniref:Pinin_SDK_memA domain-containing protein n=1 Tax=Heligmosomoides polygyrus TaxID=6339 RepID=A0A183FFS8_HELPZ|nr:unnamed protein product [Heligmosomoides polygyrus]
MVRSDERPSKRQRVEYDEVDDDDDRGSRPKRTLASTVVMPSIETKSREERIEEMNKTEKKEVTTRNRRMFSNLLQGTLTRFQRDEKKIQNVEKIQVVDLFNLLLTLRWLFQIMAERQKLFDERREQERELRALQRKKALMQYAEAKKEHYKLLRNFIQTQTKPTLFFVPAKHSLRSLELLKASEKAIDGMLLVSIDLLLFPGHTKGHFASVFTIETVRRVFLVMSDYESKVLMISYQQRVSDVGLNGEN